MNRTEHSLRTLAKNCRRFSTVAEQMATKEIPDDVRQAVEDLTE